MATDPSFDPPFDPGELVSIELEPGERRFLRLGLMQWFGPARCTDEMAAALGFVDRPTMAKEVSRLYDALDAGADLSRLDWLRVLLSTEHVFASGALGAGSDWPIVTGISDADSIVVLRQLQRKLGGVVYPLIGAGFGTMTPIDDAEAD